MTELAGPGPKLVLEISTDRETTFSVSKAKIEEDGPVAITTLGCSAGEVEDNSISKEVLPDWVGNRVDGLTKPDVLGSTKDPLPNTELDVT